MQLLFQLDMRGLLLRMHGRRPYHMLLTTDNNKK
jgi:hypothetical protein